MDYRKNFQLNLQKVSLERLDGEIIILSFSSGYYFSTSGVGADILSLISENISCTLWKQILSNYFPVTEIDENQIDEFIAKLLRFEIIQESEFSVDVKCDLPLDYQRTQWQVPELQVFSDMQNLLMVDPIHETSLEGWPEKKYD